MSKEELKKKIVEILSKVVLFKDSDSWSGLNRRTAELLADALIAARIGDMSEYNNLKIELHQKVEYIHELWVVKEDYKHRAILSERALDKAVELAYEYRTEVDTLSCSSCPMFSIFDSCKERGLYKECSKRWKEELIRQAEEEISEEEK